jgi:hypothetical protein
MMLQQQFINGFRAAMMTSGAIVAIGIFTSLGRSSRAVMRGTDLARARAPRGTGLRTGSQ